MKNLNFRFQRIFDLKDRLEETRRLALGAAVSEWERQRQALSLLQRSLIEHGTNSNSQRGDALHATLLRSGHDYAMRLERDILTQMKTVLRHISEIRKPGAVFSRPSFTIRPASADRSEGGGAGRGGAGRAGAGRVLGGVWRRCAVARGWCACSNKTEVLLL